jgi:6-pyruvoyltetrahydropterin/6-carboxytetrahydropterin synthase
MVSLTRTVRFSVNDPGAPSADGQPGDNTFAAFPSMRGLGRHYEVDINCRGEIDPASGYFLNIKEIDRAVRATLIPTVIARARHAESEPAETLREALRPLNTRLGGLVTAVRWRLSPYYSVEMSPSPTTPPKPVTIALLRQQFEFAASHRLHIPSLSDAENQELFGKCNNPRGHGHNYRIEPCIEVAVPVTGKPQFNLMDLERITAERIIARYDHKHLNEDTDEFGSGPGALNPSVENIAKVCFGLLAPDIAAAGASLRSVTVWETDKTSCTFPG